MCFSFRIDGGAAGHDLYINLTLGHSVYFTPPPSLLVQIPPNLAGRLYLRYLLGLGCV
jgi:hypothetical protein